jgi:hypothetical protein
MVWTSAAARSTIDDPKIQPAPRNQVATGLPPSR